MVLLTLLMAYFSRVTLFPSFNVDCECRRRESDSADTDRFVLRSLILPSFSPPSLANSRDGRLNASAFRAPNRMTVTTGSRTQSKGGCRRSSSCCRERGRRLSWSLVAFIQQTRRPHSSVKACVSRSPDMPAFASTLPLGSRAPVHQHSLICGPIRVASALACVQWIRRQGCLAAQVTRRSLERPRDHKDFKE